MTIHELLNHTAGTGDFFVPEFDQHRLNLRTHDDYLKLYGSRPLRFQPGSKWEYSNFGFIILGSVIERVTGQDYYSYVRDHVYLPAGMNATGAAPEGDSVPNLSKGNNILDSADF